MPLKYIDRRRGQRVLIFGGSSGLGYAVAEAAIDYGRLEDPYTEVDHNQLRTAARNLSSLDALAGNLESLLDEITDSGNNPIDHIVWTADNATSLPLISETEVNHITASLALRAYARMILARVLADSRYIRRSPNTSITFTNGVGRHKAMPGWTIPGMAGYSIEVLVRRLAYEFAPVRVNLVSAGAVDTELLRQVPENVLDSYRNVTLTGRLGRVEDVAGTYLYLMKDGNATGSVLRTDGGGCLLKGIISGLDI